MLIVWLLSLVMGLSYLLQVSLFLFGNFKVLIGLVSVGSVRVCGCSWMFDFYFSLKFV